MASSGVALEKRRRLVEATATFGLILVAAALLAPFATFLGGGDSGLVSADSTGWRAADPSESTRLRRLRRLEFWAGMAFCIGAFFWFYNSRKLSGMLYVGQMAVLRDTVVFSLAGAMIQIIASWMIVWRQKRESAEIKNSGEDNGSGKRSGK